MLLWFAAALAASATGACAAPNPTPEGDDADRSREGFLPGAGGARIHYRVVGSAPDTLVAVHGGPGAGMHAVLPELEPLAERHTVIFYDQRGGGRSALPADTARLHARWHVADLEAVRRFFGLDRMTLVAHSFGAILVARYAREHPDRVERMVFFGAVGPRRSDAAARARAAAEPPDPALRKRLREVMRALLEGTSADPVADCREYEAIGRELALARGESGEWSGTNCAMPAEAVRYYFRYTARVSPRSFGKWDFTDSMWHVEAPLLVVHGALHPESIPLQRDWARALPEARLLLIPGAGKAVSADRPEAFYRAVETFLAGEWPEGA
ncbi:MAG: alpha/beta hydrolase, partial [Gemmatimonadota bacterium]|nr:alpha/beta hydrolase [Gemmatimonadota bacterium]